MKKICFVFNSINESNGVANAAISIANILVENGYDITLIAVFGTDGTYQKYLSDRVKVVTIFDFNFRGFVRLLYLLPLSFLYRMIIKERYDIEVAFQYGIATKALAFSQNRDAKHFVWMHSYDKGLTLRKYYLKFDRLISVSKYNADQFLNELGMHFNVSVIYNPIDEIKVQKMSLETPPETLPSTPLFVSVGRLHKQKGYERLLRCLSRLKVDGFYFNFLLLGDGPERNNLITMIKELNLNDCVVLLGAKDNPHMYTKRSDLFICSSYYEGYSTACMEAQMLGVPMLTTKVPGANEMVEMSECGMVVNNDENSLYMGLKKILESPSILISWKDKLENTKDRYSRENKISKLLSLFE